MIMSGADLLSQSSSLSRSRAVTPSRVCCSIAAMHPALQSASMAESSAARSLKRRQKLPFVMRRLFARTSTRTPSTPKRESLAKPASIQQSFFSPFIGDAGLLPERSCPNPRSAVALAEFNRSLQRSMKLARRPLHSERQTSSRLAPAPSQTMLRAHSSDQ